MFVNVNGTRLYFDVEGAGLVPDGPRMRQKPTLVLLHGGPGFDHSLLKPVFSQLSDVAQIVYYDHRGNGRSVGSTAETWNLAQWGDDVKGLCDALGVQKPIVYGVSFGGFVAQAYATRHPDHPGKLILANTAAHIDFDAVYAAFEKFGGSEAERVAREFWADVTDETWARYLQVCMPLYNSRPKSDTDWRMRAIATPEVGVHFNGPKREHGRMDYRAALKTVTCPTLVLAGGKDPVTPIEFSDIIAECLPSDLVRYERFENCGHPVHIDDPKRAFAVMREFILAE